MWRTGAVPAAPYDGLARWARAVLDCVDKKSRHAGRLNSNRWRLEKTRSSCPGYVCAGAFALAASVVTVMNTRPEWCRPMENTAGCVQRRFRPTITAASGLRPPVSIAMESALDQPGLQWGDGGRPSLKWIVGFSPRINRRTVPDQRAFRRRSPGRSKCDTAAAAASNARRARPAAGLSQADT